MVDAVVEPFPRIGRVSVEGNTITDQDVIFRHVRLKPGDRFKPEELKAAERRLRKANLFDLRPGFEPKVTLVPGDQFGYPYRQVRVAICETHTGAFRIEPRSNSLVFLAEQRNFDPRRLPLNYDDIWSGKAFLGGGRLVRIEVRFAPVHPLVSAAVVAPAGILP